MRLRIIVPVTVAALLALGCTDTPTDPTMEVEPVFNAGQGPDRGMVLLDVFDQTFPDYYACANGGAGADVIVSGHYEFWGREVATPSGNLKQHGELRGEETLEEPATGNVWKSLAFVVPTIFYNTRHSDGYTILNEPVWVVYENQQTGEIIRVKFLYHVVFGADFEIVRLDFKYSNCIPWNGQIH